MQFAKSIFVINCILELLQDEKHIILCIGFHSRMQKISASSVKNWTIDEMNMPTYVISLRKAKERRDWISSHLTSCGIDFQFVDAIDAQELSNAEILEKIEPERRGWTEYLRPGAVCCALSHIEAYIQLLKTDSSSCLILEDDAELTYHGKKFATNTELERLDNGFDVTLLYSQSTSPIQLTRTEGHLIGGDCALYRCTDEFPGSSVAYTINRKAATRISKFNTPIKATSDAWDGFSKELDLQIGVVKPDLFKTGEFESTIDYLDVKRKWVKRILPEWARRIRRKSNLRKGQGNVQT